MGIYENCQNEWKIIDFFKNLFVQKRFVQISEIDFKTKYLMEKTLLLKIFTIQLKNSVFLFFVFFWKFSRFLKIKMLKCSKS